MVERKRDTESAYYLLLRSLFSSGQNQEIAGIAEAALARAWKAGFRDPDWVRRDPDIAILPGDPEFERLYPEGSGA